MKNNIQSLTYKERKEYTSLANALKIELSELLSLDFYNENIFDAGGEINKIKYFFSDKNTPGLLSKIKGLDDNNTIILSTKDLDYNL